MMRSRLCWVLALAGCVLAGGEAGATPTTVTLPGWVPETGAPLELTIDYSTDFVSWWNGGAGDGAVQTELVSGAPIVDLSGLWTGAQGRCIDIRTLDEVQPGLCGQANPFLRIRLDVALDTSDGTDQLLFNGELWWPSGSDLGDIDGTEFLQHFARGEVELLHEGTTVLRGQVVPEPATVLLLGLGVIALAGRRRA